MKRYLTGIDWVIYALDYSGKKKTGIGNVSQVVIEFDGLLDSAMVQDALRSFLQKFPLINGCSSRWFNLCPYWKISSHKKQIPVRVQVIRLDTDADPFLALAAGVNAPFVHSREYLVFNLVLLGTRSFLGMIFDHRILDARGAEAFLDLFQRSFKKEPFSVFEIHGPAHLDHWKEKFASGQQVNKIGRADV